MGGWGQRGQVDRQGSWGMRDRVASRQEVCNEGRKDVRGSRRNGCRGKVRD